VPVVIAGANFIPSPLPTARLGTGVNIAISAATTDTLIGTVPAGIQAGVYALTVMNADGRSATLSPAYTAQEPSNPNTTLETGYLSIFGPDAPGSDGDDDHVQIIFFQVPDSYTGPLHVRIFDANTGGEVDETPRGIFDTTMRYALLGGAGAYTTPSARWSHPDETGIQAGTLLMQAEIGDDPAYDNNWALVLSADAGDGETVGSSRMFKVVVQGISGDDGNLYNVALSTVSDDNVAPAGSRAFAYSWTFPMPSDVSQRPSLYPYVPAGTATVEQHNWDADYIPGDPDTMTLHTPVQSIIVPASGMSGDNEGASSAFTVVDGERQTTWTVTMEFSSASLWNDLTFWVLGDGVALPIFAYPTTAPPP